MDVEEIAIRPVYLLVDASGSTAHSGFNTVCNMALPRLIGSLEESDRAAFHLSVLLFHTTGSTVLSLTPARAVDFIPSIASGGFSSLAAGLRALAAAAVHDAEQLAADHLRVDPALVVILTDGLPTDSAAQLRAAFTECCGDARADVDAVLVLLAGAEVAAALAGLGEGCAAPDVDVVELPAMDATALSDTVGSWLARRVAD